MEKIDRKKFTLLCGKHASEAVILNKDRKCEKIYVTPFSNKYIQEFLLKNNKNIPIEVISKSQLVKFISQNAGYTSQRSVNIAVLVQGTKKSHVDEIIKKISKKKRSVIVILDEITGIYNIGAIIRSSLAFGADAIFITQANSPEIEGMLLESSCGASERIATATMNNLSSTIDSLKSKGYWCYGLDMKGDNSIDKIFLHEKIALILGSEDKGMRKLTRKKCDYLIRINMEQNSIESINVSNAAAIALHHIFLR